MPGTTLILDQDGPAITPPNGEVSDFDNDGSHEIIEVALITCAVLVALSVLSRVWSRLSMKPRLFGIEEGLLICALGTFSSFIYIVYQIAIFPGIFVHQWNVRLRDFGIFTWQAHIGSIFYCLTLMLLKVAILFDWARLFNPLKKRNVMFWAIRILLATHTVYYITATFLEAFRCTPQRELWADFYEKGYCPINAVVLNLAASVVNVVSDVAILALPQWVIWNLNMPRATKAGVSGLFLIGIFAVICAFCRMAWLTKLLDSKDEIYLTPIAGAFAMGEMIAAFLIVGVPSVPRVFRTLFSEGSAVRSLLSRIRLRSWNGRSRTSDGPDGGSGRTLGRPPRHSPAHHAPRGLWEISDNDTFDLFSVSTTDVEASHFPVHDVSFPQNSVKRDMRVDVVNERIG